MLVLVVWACGGLLGEKSTRDDTAVGGDSATSVFPESGRMVGVTEAHNEVRREYGVPDLTYDTILEAVSADWIAHLASNGCILEHNWNSPLGENLFWSNYPASPDAVVESWASEVQYYDYESNSCDPGQMCGHYTQIIWSTTERVGCSVGACDDGSEIWMCNYDPPGNMVGVLPY